MKRLTAVLITIIAVIFFTGPSFGENETLKRECETKVREAALLIKKLGAQAAFEKITDPKGTFVGKYSHVFCIDSESGHLLAHKSAMYVGYNMHSYQDADNNAPYSEMLKGH